MYSEKRAQTATGWGALALGIFLFGVSIWMFIASIGGKDLPMMGASLFSFALGVLVLAGLFVVNPNEAVAFR